MIALLTVRESQQGRGLQDLHLKRSAPSKTGSGSRDGGGCQVGPSPTSAHDDWTGRGQDTGVYASDDSVLPEDITESVSRVSPAQRTRRRAMISWS